MSVPEQPAKGMPDRAGAEAPTPLSEALASSAMFLRWTLAALGVAYVLSGAFIVGPEEEAAVLTFGRLSGMTREEQVKGPGLHFALPSPFEEVVKFPVRRLRTMTVETFSRTAEKPEGEGAKEKKDAKKAEKPEDRPGTGDELPNIQAIPGLDPATEGCLMTADTNLVRATVVVRWQVRDLPAYLFRHADAERVLREQVESAALSVVGGMPVDELLTEGRDRARDRIVQRVQEGLDRMETGIEVASLDMPMLEPPAFLAEAFRDVNAARVEARALTDEANAYRSQSLPAAQAEANRVVKSAEQYRAERVLKARGEVGRFNYLLARYRADPKVFKSRMYAEAVEQILEGVERKVILPPGASQAGTVRLLLDAPAAEEPARAPRRPAAPAEKRGP